MIEGGEKVARKDKILAVLVQEMNQLDLQSVCQLANNEIAGEKKIVDRPRGTSLYVLGYGLCDLV